MKFSKITPFNFITAASITLILSAGLNACSSNDSSSTGLLSVSVTDAPVDEAEKVVVEFRGVEIKPANGDSITFDFTDKCTADPLLCQIDLLALTNGFSEQILNGEIVPAGQYNWMRLKVNAEQNVRDSYITIAGEEFELRIPSGAQTGLKLNRGFIVPADDEASFTIDFDLRKSVHDSVGTDYYILRPTLRMVDNTETGTLSGNVDSSFFTNDCTANAEGITTSAVYVFEGTVTTPDDEDGEGFGPDPITSALVENDGVSNYKVGFLSAGDYLIAFTCDAAVDDPTSDDATIKFQGAATISITANNNTVHNFLP